MKALKKGIRYIRLGVWKVGKYHKSGSRYYLFANNKYLYRLSMRDLKKLKELIERVEQSEDKNWKFR